MLSNDTIGAIMQLLVNQNAVVRILLGYAIEINHLPMYLYHNRNYSVNAKAFLLIFRNMSDLMDNLPQNYVFPNEKIDYESANSICGYKYSFSSYALNLQT